MDILYTDSGGNLVSLWIDAAITEAHEATAEPTKYPVGTTRQGTDHVLDNPDRLSIEGIVSNTPLSVPPDNLDGVTGQVSTVGKASVLNFSGEFDRAAAVDRLLRQLKTNHTFLSVATSLRTYENMVIARYASKRDANSQKSLVFTLDLEQVRVANSEVTTVPDPLEPRGREERSRGTQAGEEATGARRSFLQALIDESST